MKQATLLSLLSLVGLVIAVIAIIDTNRPPVVETSAMPHPELPFTSYVAGAGIVEGERGNTAIGTAIAGVVKTVPVKVGDEVIAGTPLFLIDDSGLQAQLLTAQARVSEAKVDLEKPQHRLAFALQLKRRDASAISEQALSDLRDDVAAAVAALETAEAQVEQLEKDIARCVVRAPAAGRILKINIRVGEYADAGSLPAPLMLFGDDTRVHLRVDVDENEALRIHPGARAIAYVRDNPQQKVLLRFEYIEPYVVPKSSLTGQSSERTDIRVLQVIYSFNRSVLPVYIGQQMDVYIEAPPEGGASSKRSP